MTDEAKLTLVDHVNKQMLNHFKAHLDNNSLPMKLPAVANQQGCIVVCCLLLLLLFFWFSLFFRLDWT